MTPDAPRTDFSRVDWRRDDIGRISVRTDARTREEWRTFMRLLDRLYEDGQHDVLLALRGRGRRPVRLAEIKAEVERTGDLGVQGLLSRVLLTKDLYAVLDDAAGRLGTSQETRDRYAYTLKKLVALRVVVPGRTRVRELASIDWRAIRPQWKGKGGKVSSASDWNHVGRFLSAALTELLGSGRTGEQHPFRLRVMDRFPTEKEHEREVTLTLDQFTALVEQLPEKARGPIVTLAVTGLRLSEYLDLTPAQLEPAACVLRVTGKTGEHEPVKVQPTVWPIVAAAVPCAMKPGALRRALGRAGLAVGYPGLRLHDLRHLNAIAMLWAGASLAAARDQLRHADSTMTMRYAKGANRDEGARAAAEAFEPALRVVRGGKSA